MMVCLMVLVSTDQQRPVFLTYHGALEDVLRVKLCTASSFDQLDSEIWAPISVG